MTVKTAPENSGLVKVQLSHLIDISISHFFQVKVTMTVKTAPENSGLVKVQLSNLINLSISQNFLYWKWRCCKDCPRELWFGQGSVIKSHKYINIIIFYLVKVKMTVKTAPENSGLVKVQLSNPINVSISQNFSGESDDACKGCPRELWFGQGSVIKSKKYQYHKKFFWWKWRWL